MAGADTVENGIAQEVDAKLDAWRAKAVGVVLLIAVVTIAPSMLAVLSGRILELAWPLRGACLLLYLLTLLALLRPRWKPLWRAVIMLAVLAVFSMIQLAVTQLSGSGRLSLIALPLLALVLVGTRAGWLTAGLSLSIYAAVAYFVQSGSLAHWSADQTIRHNTSYWLLQGLRLGGQLALLTALFTQLLALQRRTMVAERRALRDLEARTAERQRLEAEVARVSEAERRKLGAELHDGVCQNLTAALLNCTALENRQAAAGAPDAEEVALIREAIEASIDMAYDAARGLCPVDVDAEGLMPALEELCRAVRRRGIACELQADEDATVGDPDRALQLYRIANEAVTNAAKHADCARIVLRVRRLPGGLALSVADDGKGMPHETGDGLGLRIMGYRAGLLGAELKVSSAGGRGTTITCRVPETGGSS